MLTHADGRLRGTFAGEESVEGRENLLFSGHMAYYEFMYGLTEVILECIYVKEVFRAKQKSEGSDFYYYPNL